MRQYVSTASQSWIAPVRMAASMKSFGEVELKANQLRTLLGRWREEAAILRRRGAVECGDALLSCAADLEAALGQMDDVVLTLTEAQALSGYTSDHLARLVRKGKIPNAGRQGAPRIRRSHLPQKPADLASTDPKAYDPIADARKLGSRREGGANAS